MSHLARKREIKYLETLLIVKTAVAAVNALSGKDPGSALQDLVNDYTDLVYPERSHQLEDKVEKTKRLLEREFAKGPFQVQAQDYDKKRKPKRK